MDRVGVKVYLAKSKQILFVFDSVLSNSAGTTKWACAGLPGAPGASDRARSLSEGSEVVGHSSIKVGGRQEVI